MRSNPLSRGAVSVTLEHSREPRRREASPRRHRHDRRACAAHGRHGRARDDHVPRRAAARAPGHHGRSARSPSTPGRFDLVGVRWHGSGNVQLQRSLDDRRLGAVARRSVGRGRPAGRGIARGEVEPRLAHRQSDLGRACERDPVSHHRHGARSPGLVRPEPRAEDPAPRRRLGRFAADRAAQRVGCRRVDPPRRALLRADDPVRERASHRGHERLLALAGRPRSCGGSRSTTSSPTAGTTSATTSSSTATAPSTRGATAASTRT